MKSFKIFFSQVKVKYIITSLSRVNQVEQKKENFPTSSEHNMSI